MPFLDDLGAAVGGAFCTWLGGVGNAEAWLQRSTGFPVGGVGAGIRGALCDDPTPPPPTPPPFDGGQCPGVLYLVAFSWEECGSPRGNTVGPAPGPIAFEGIEVLVEDDGPCGPDDMKRWRWNGRGGDGIDVDQVFTNVDGSIDVSITRADGLPDDCGNPAPIIPPFQPPNLPITVPDPDGGPDIDLDLTINAPIVIGPNVFAPVSITGPDINFNGTIELNPEFAINIGSGFGGGGGGGTEVAPDGEDISPESPDNPPQADGRRIIGLIVTLDIDSQTKATQLAQDGDIESIYVPRVAIAYLISNNGGVRVPLSGVDLKLRNTYIPVPPNVEVVTWRIHTEPGTTVENVRPVYGTTRPAV